MHIRLLYIAQTLLVNVFIGMSALLQVMEKVEIGYRLPPPPGCSRFLYHLMIDCW